MTETDSQTPAESTAFPEIKPVDAGPELARFMTAMRRLQDIVVSTNPDGAVWADGADQIEELCARLEDHRARRASLPPVAGPTCRGSAIP